eukprot:1963633-Pyramimonas_sp.AAC.2
MSTPDVIYHSAHVISNIPPNIRRIFPVGRLPLVGRQSTLRRNLTAEELGSPLSVEPFLRRFRFNRRRLRLSPSLFTDGACAQLRAPSRRLGSARVPCLGQMELDRSNRPFCIPYNNLTKQRPGWMCESSCLEAETRNSAFRSAFA